MNRRIMTSLLGLIILTTIAGCATDHLLRKPENNKMSLVVVYIDTSEASLKLTWAEAKRVKPKPTLWYQFGLNPDGILYNNLIDPGAYVFVRLGGVTNKREMTRQLPQQGRGKLAMVIKEPGVYFLGSYKYKRIPPKDFSFTRYELRRTKSPSEREVLTKMQKYAISPVWKERLMRRIQQLK